jgi:hypothetical protein
MRKSSKTNLFNLAARAFFYLVVVGLVLKAAVYIGGALICGVALQMLLLGFK